MAFNQQEAHKHTVTDMVMATVTAMVMAIMKAIQYLDARE